MAAFVDTNLLLYAFASGIPSGIPSGIQGDAKKVVIAKRLVSDLIAAGDIVVSAQVLNEFSANAIRKGNPRSPSSKQVRLWKGWRARPSLSLTLLLPFGPFAAFKPVGSAFGTL